MKWSTTGRPRVRIRATFWVFRPRIARASITGTSIYKLESGKIVEQWSHWNLMSMMEQLGVAANMAQAGTAAEKQKA